MSLALSQCVLGGVHLSYWMGGAKSSDVAELRASIERSAPAVLLLIVPSDTPMSDRDARHDAVQLVRQLGSKVAGIAIALEGDGFWKAAVRAMFTGIATAARPRVPWAIFDDADAAAAWASDRVERQVGKLPDFLKLLSEIERLRTSSPER